MNAQRYFNPSILIHKKNECIKIGFFRKHKFKIIKKLSTMM
jgi:hypothetical protein